jgi:hypothetical protein
MYFEDGSDKLVSSTFRKTFYRKSAHHNIGLDPQYRFGFSFEG